MLKAADALYAAGYEVRVISTRTSGWAATADAAIGKSREWRWRVVNYGRADSPVAWLLSGCRHQAARLLARVQSAMPPSVISNAFSRIHRELVEAILEEPVDLIYGGTTGALAAVAEAGHHARTAFAIDFEDFHCAEHPSPEGDLSNSLARSVMRVAAEGAAFVTAGSEAIARACRHELGIPAMPINNVFPLPQHAPSEPPQRLSNGEFAVYWFSQTIGEGRGIEDVIRALGLTQRRASFTLRGCPAAGYIERLRALAAREAPQIRVLIEAPTSPESMVERCRSFDLGVSSEQPLVRNRALSLPNKAVTYPLAGLPVALTRTPGHEPLARDLAEGAVVFTPGDPEALAAQLDPLMTVPSRLAEARIASWRAARTRWHWEHQCERGALLTAVNNALS